MLVKDPPCANTGTRQNQLICNPQLSIDVTSNNNNNNNGLFIRWLATVHIRLNYILVKSVGLGLSACNYNPRSHMLCCY